VAFIPGVCPWGPSGDRFSDPLRKRFRLFPLRAIAILRWCCFPKVCPSRVRRLTVDVADFGVRPLASHIEPSKAACRIRPAINANLMVAPAIFCAGYSASRSATASAHFPSKYPSSRGVPQNFAKSFCSQHGQPKYLSKHRVNQPRGEYMSLPMLGMWHSSCRKPNNGPLSGGACPLSGVKRTYATAP